MVHYSKRADKDLHSLPKYYEKLIRGKLHTLDESGYGNVKSLKGALKGYFRVAVGDYRAIVDIDQDIIHVISVSHRQGTYK